MILALFNDRPRPLALGDCSIGLLQQCLIRADRMHILARHCEPVGRERALDWAKQSIAATERKAGLLRRKSSSQ